MYPGEKRNVFHWPQRRPSTPIDREKQLRVREQSCCTRFPVHGARRNTASCGSCEPSPKKMRWEFTTRGQEALALSDKLDATNRCRFIQTYLGNKLHHIYTERNLKEHYSPGADKLGARAHGCDSLPFEPYCRVNTTGLCSGVHRRVCVISGKSTSSFDRLTYLHPKLAPREDENIVDIPRQRGTSHASGTLLFYCSIPSTHLPV